jgi:hypothetical protein
MYSQLLVLPPPDPSPSSLLRGLLQESLEASLVVSQTPMFLVAFLVASFVFLTRCSYQALACFLNVLACESMLFICVSVSVVCACLSS